MGVFGFPSMTWLHDTQYLQDIIAGVGITIGSISITTYLVSISQIEAIFTMDNSEANMLVSQTESPAFAVIAEQGITFDKSEYSMSLDISQYGIDISIAQSAGMVLSTEAIEELTEGVSEALIDKTETSPTLTVAGG